MFLRVEFPWYDKKSVVYESLILNFFLKQLLSSKVNNEILYVRPCKGSKVITEDENL